MKSPVLRLITGPTQLPLRCAVNMEQSLPSFPFCLPCLVALVTGEVKGERHGPWGREPNSQVPKGSHMLLGDYGWDFEDPPSSASQPSAEAVGHCGHWSCWCGHCWICQSLKSMDDPGGGEVEGRREDGRGEPAGVRGGKYRECQLLRRDSHLCWLSS